MATLESLGYKSISALSQDEAIELLRQIRLSRRTPVSKPSTKKTTSKSVAKKATKHLDKQSINELLDMIGE